MFITKKHIPRRTFLQSAGVTLALPLLESMIPASTALAQTAAAPTPRFVGIFYPHGMAPGYWEPKAEGALPEKLRETAYALACDVAAADGKVTQEEARILQMVRDHLQIGRLPAAAIERGSRARHTH